MTAVERRYDIGGYTLAAKEWHADKSFKVIALHGWLDNAASFDVLAPLLPECHIIALDLPGHGLSDHKPPQGSYNIWDDLVDIGRLANLLGWQRFSLLGHSRGAMMALLLAVSLPERVHSLMLLDALTPLPKPASEVASQLSQFVKSYLSLQDRRLPSYPSMEDALNARLQASDMAEEAAQLIVDRGLRKEGDVYRWTTDARLTKPSAVRMTEEHNRVLVAALQAPCLVLLAEHGLVQAFPLLEEVASYANVDYEILPGRHHFHMEQQAPLVAEKLRRYIDGLEQTPEQLGG